MKRMLIAAACLVATSGSAQPEAGGTNLLLNASFEQAVGGDRGLPVDWATYTTAKLVAEVTTHARRDGQQSLHFTAQGLPRAVQGLTQRIAVVAGEKYTFTANAMNDEADPLKGSAYFQIGIEWVNAGGHEICRNFTAPQGLTLSRVRWETVALRKVRAPASAVEAVVGLHFVDGDRAGKGSVFVDDTYFSVAR